MIIPIHSMINLIEDFIDSSANNITVGGMVGTQIFKHVFDICIGRFAFERILLVEGCQDFIGISKKSPMNNHFFWTSLIRNKIVPNPFANTNPFRQDVLQTSMRIEYMKELNDDVVNKYSVVIICDAHLIPADILDMFMRKTCGKLIMIVDPFGVHGERFTARDIPCITETFHKTSTIVAMARGIYDIETNAIDKKISCNVNEIKRLSVRSIGKIDDKQYVTNDKGLAEYIREKQINSGFRKNQKLFITDNGIYRNGFIRDELNPSYLDNVMITRNSMGIIDKTNADGVVELRLWRHKPSDPKFANKFIYENDNIPLFLKKYASSASNITVIPANVLMIEEYAYHKFQNTVFVNGGFNLSKREMYTLLANTMNLTVTEG